MDERLQEMLDHYEITKTLKEYCFACDRCDEVRMADVYLEDSWDDHGDFAGPGRDFAKLMTEEILGTTDSLSHMLGQSQIKVDGDQAGAETYFLAVFRNVNADGTPTCHQLGGRFVDKLRREDGRWRIWHRTAVRDWSVSLPVEADYVAARGLKEGHRSMDDPAFAALGLVHAGRMAAASAA